jgi:hypothetical protein
LKPRQTAKAARDPKPTSDRAVARTALRWFGVGARESCTAILPSSTSAKITRGSALLGFTDPYGPNKISDFQHADAKRKRRHI